MPPPPTIAILTEGLTDPLAAKTAVSLLRYRRDDIAALIDSSRAGQNAAVLLGVGEGIPIVASLDALPDVSSLYLGVATPGGTLPPPMRRIILAALGRGLAVVSGLHQFLIDDPDLAAAAQRGGGRLIDVRRNAERSVADRKGLAPACLKIHTVGQDCSCGKMVTSVELARGLQAAGRDAKFVATGQSGIMIAPGVNAALPPHPQHPEEHRDPTAGGLPIDCIVADFINGAAEKLVRQNQHHDILIIEGQASLVHPSYSSVTYGLLHGTLPDGLVLCYEAGRPHLHGRPHLPLTPLATVKKLYEHVANLEKPCPFIGVSMSSRLLKDEAAIQAERKRVEDELQLPVCDVWRDGPGSLVEAVVALKRE